MGNGLIPQEIIENKIYFIRGHKVMLDEDLAKLYEVETRILNRNVKRNIERFPEEFMFQLTDEEWKVLISQIGISNKGRGGRQKLPYVFTEHGILMLSNVINSKRAIAVSIQIIKIFNRLRKEIANNIQLAKKIAEIENKLSEHDENFKTVFEVLKQLIETPEEPKKQIGFRTDED